MSHQGVKESEQELRMLKDLLKRVLLMNISHTATFKEKMEALTPEEKHGLLHKTNILCAA